MQYDQFLMVRDLQPLKHYSCPDCHRDAILLVDVDTDTMPLLDDDGDLQYFCLGCGIIFAIPVPNL